MTRSTAEALLPGQNTLREARGIMGQLFDGLIADPHGFVATPTLGRVLLDDSQLALTLSIPQRAQSSMRDEGMWMIVKPQGEHKWTVSFVEPGNFNSQKEISAARATYRALVRKVQGIQAGVTNSTLLEDIALLQGAASEIYDHLPEATKREIENEGLSPHNAFGQIVW